MYTYTHTHTHKTAHACNICNLNLFMFVLSTSCRILSLKNKTKHYSCWNSCKTESLGRDKYTGWEKESLYVQPRSCGLYPWNEQYTCTALPGTWPWASLPSSRTQPTGQGPNRGVFCKVGRWWGRGGGGGEVTQLQQSGLFSKKNHI